jgi:hypothetical protein
LGARPFQNFDDSKGFGEFGLKAAKELNPPKDIERTGFP